MTLASNQASFRFGITIPTRVGLVTESDLTSSDECFIVLRGAIEVEVEGIRTVIKEREFCCFPVGVFHAVTKVFPPVETLMLRAPSIEDKIYHQEEKPL